MTIPSQRGLPYGAWDIIAKRAPTRQGFGGGPAPLPPLAPGPAHVPIVPAAQIPPPELFPWPTATDFAADGTQVGLTSVNTPVVLASFQVPAQNVGVVRDINTVINTLLLTSAIRFRIKLNGGVPQGWDWTTFPRNAASVSGFFDPSSTVIRVPEGQLVELEVQVTDAGTYQISGGFHGWFWSKTTDDAFRSNWPS